MLFTPYFVNALRTLSFTHALGKIPVIFWYKKSLIIESNVFVISIVGSNVISIVEKGRKVTNEIVLNAKTTAWVTKTLEWIEGVHQDFQAW